MMRIGMRLIKEREGFCFGNGDFVLGKGFWRESSLAFFLKRNECP